MDEAAAADTPVKSELDEEWEDAFFWSSGPRLWNIGCG